MAARYQALGWLGKNVHYTEYPGVEHSAWIPAYKDAELLRTLAAIRRDPAAPKTPLSPPPAGRGDPGPRRQERPPPAPASLRLRHEWPARGGGRRAGAGERPRRLGADDRGEVHGQERPRGDRRRSRAVQPGAGRRGAAQYARRASSRVPMPDARPLGDRAFRAQVADRAPPAGTRWSSAPSRRGDSRGCSASRTTTGTPGRPRATARSRCSTTRDSARGPSAHLIIRPSNKPVRNRILTALEENETMPGGGRMNRSRVRVHRDSGWRGIGRSRLRRGQQCRHRQQVSSPKARASSRTSW